MKKKERVSDGNIVVLYGGVRDKYLIEYKPNFEKSVQVGLFKLPEIMYYGDKIITNVGKSLYVIKPTTSDMIMNVKRKTTIMYPKEIGYILLETDVGSGSIVAEVGSGSGGLTIALAVMVGSEGKVYSFDRNEEFLNNARLNLKQYNLDNRCEFILRDVSENGFGLTDLDAVFIDIAEPWTVVQSAHNSLKAGRAIASISPNVEQVKRMRNEMDRIGFVDIRTVELLMRELLVREAGTRPKEMGITHTGYLTFGRKISI